MGGLLSDSAIAHHTQTTVPFCTALNTFGIYLRFLHHHQWIEDCGIFFLCFQSLLHPRHSKLFKLCLCKNLPFHPSKLSTQLSSLSSSPIVRMFLSNFNVCFYLLSTLALVCCISNFERISLRFVIWLGVSC